MNDPANRKGKDPVALVLLTVAGLLGAFSLWRLSALAVPAKTPQVEVAVAKKTQPGDAQAQVAADKSVAAGLKKKNLFNPPGAPSNPVKEVAGILGNEALINGQWYKVGAKVGEGPNMALIVAVEPTRVRVKWNGKESEFLPINASGASASSSGPRPPEGGSARPAGEGPRGMRVGVRGESAAAAPPPGARRGEIPPDLRDRIRNASSDDERQRLMEEVRQRSGL
jgi:hypothetical protein